MSVATDFVSMISTAQSDHQTAATALDTAVANGSASEILTAVQNFDSTLQSLKEIERAQQMYNQQSQP